MLLFLESKITATHHITDMDIIQEDVQTNHPKTEEVLNAATNVIPQKLDFFVKVDEDNSRHNMDGPTKISVKETCGFNNISKKVGETPEKTKFDIVPSKPCLTEVYYFLDTVIINAFHLVNSELQKLSKKRLISNCQQIHCSLAFAFLNFYLRKSVSSDFCFAKK